MGLRQSHKHAPDKQITEGSGKLHEEKLCEKVTIPAFVYMQEPSCKE
jgi:hypothetical protein